MPGKLPEMAFGVPTPDIFARWVTDFDEYRRLNGLAPMGVKETPEQKAERLRVYALEYAKGRAEEKRYAKAVKPAIDALAAFLQSSPEVKAICAPIKTDDNFELCIGNGDYFITVSRNGLSVAEQNAEL